MIFEFCQGCSYCFSWIPKISRKVARFLPVQDFRTLERIKQIIGYLNNIFVEGCYHIVDFSAPRFIISLWLISRFQKVLDNEELEQIKALHS